MKKIEIAIILLCIILLGLMFYKAVGQSTGVWKMPGGSTIYRVNDSTQIEVLGGNTDTFRIKWINPKIYQVIGATILTVTITRTFENGDYKGVVSDGKFKRSFRAELVR